MKRRQEQLGRSFRHKYPVGRTGKVIAVRRAGNTVDLAMLSGGYLLDVPVSMGAASTAAGLINLIAPTVDTTIPVQKTYPVANNEVVQPPLEDVAGGETPDTPVNRDIYALCMPFEGGSRSGFVVMGFMYAPSSEMLFDIGDQQEFSDFFLYRHPSDIQTTIDRNGTVSIQHPAGTRITIGDINAIQAARGNGPSDPRKPKAGVNLTGLDLNGNYKLRKGLAQQPAVMIEDAAGSHVLLDGHGIIDIQDGTGDTINLDGVGTITIKNVAGAMAVLDQANIKLTAPGDLEAVVTGLVSISAQLMKLTASDIAFKTALYTTTLNAIITIFNLHEHPYFAGLVPSDTSSPAEKIP